MGRRAKKILTSRVGTRATWPSYLHVESPSFAIRYTINPKPSNDRIPRVMCENEGRSRAGSVISGTSGRISPAERNEFERLRSCDDGGKWRAGKATCEASVPLKRRGGGYRVNAGIHAIDVALPIEGQTPVGATGMSRIVRADPHGDSHDIFSLTYEFQDGVIPNHRSEHLRNHSDCRCECIAQGRDGGLDTSCTTRVRILGTHGGWHGGDVVVNLYLAGAERNIDTFHKSDTRGVCDNRTGRARNQRDAGDDPGRGGRPPRDEADPGRSARREPPPGARSDRPEGMKKKGREPHVHGPQSNLLSDSVHATGVIRRRSVRILFSQAKLSHAAQRKSLRAQPKH